MLALIVSIILMVAVFFVQKTNPFIAGLMAVIPIKILGTAWMAPGSDSLVRSIEGMLIGQFLIGFALLAAWLFLK